VFKVGNGENIFLWLDYWHPDGVLREIYGNRVIYDAGSQLDAKWSSVPRNRNWYWQAAVSDDLLKIQSKLSLVSMGDVDLPTWGVSKKGVYNCANTWNVIRHKQRL